MNAKIPKRIIQIWGSPSGKSVDLPLLSKAAVANVRLLNHDFEYLLFDNKQIEKFIDEQVPEYRSVFHSFRFPIQRFDFLRYLAVYLLGGFYFDLDVFLASNLSELLPFGCVFPFEELTINSFLRREYGMDWEIGNYGFGAAAGHPFLQAIIKNCLRAQRDPEWVEPMLRGVPRMFRDRYYVFCTTGPGLVSRTLAEYPDASKDVKVLFPENVCDSSNWHRFGEYGVHLMEGRWHKGESMWKRRLAAKWILWKQKQMIREGLKRGRRRSLEFKRKS